MSAIQRFVESLSPWQFFVTFLGWLSDPFQWLSDLQLGDEKVTLNRRRFFFPVERSHDHEF